MADDTLIQGKSNAWLVNDAGQAHVVLKASDVSLGAAASYDLKSHTVGSDTYYGEAAIGSATSSAVWRVKKVTVQADGDPQVAWETSANFDKVWDTYEAL